MKKIVIFTILAIFISLPFYSAVFSLNVTNAAAEFEYPYIYQPDHLPGPTEKDIEDEKEKGGGVRQIFTTQLLPRYTVILTGFVGAMAFLYLIISGVRFATAYGNEEAATKAKNQMIYALVAFFIALLAYTIVSIIINVEFVGTTPSS